MVKLQFDVDVIWRLYIVRCRDGTLYTGITNDIVHRLAKHNDGTGSRYTRSRLPVELIYQEPCSGRSEALRKEHAIKKLSRTAKKAYIQRNEK